MSGSEFAEILKGLAKLDEVKSIIYKRNALSIEAINALEPLLRNRVPHNLEEIRMIDIKSNITLNDDLINRISFGSKLRKLALVNCQQSDKSFENLLKFIKDSLYLYELDLSWNGVRHATFVKLI